MPGDDLLFHCLSSSTIGAVGFHGRVRDGIGWDTDAMVTRQWSPSWGTRCHASRVTPCASSQSVRIAKLCWFNRCTVLLAGILSRPTLMLAVWNSQARIELLVPVSFTRHRASTSGLSRSWSSTALRSLISREASRLDAFSGYPVRT
jgi:hypothetical protein